MLLKTDIQYVGYANVGLILWDQDSTLHPPVEEVRLSEVKWSREFLFTLHFDSVCTVHCIELLIDITNLHTSKYIHIRR